MCVLIPLFLLLQRTLLKQLSVCLFSGNKDNVSNVSKGPLSVVYSHILETVDLTANIQLSGNKVTLGIPTVPLSSQNVVVLVCYFEMVKEEMGKLREQDLVHLACEPPGVEDACSSSSFTSLEEESLCFISSSVRPQNEIVQKETLVSVSQESLPLIQVNFRCFTCQSGFFFFYF